MAIKSAFVFGLLATSAIAARPHSTAYQQAQFSQQFTDSYNFLKYVGGTGPYSDRTGYGIDPNAPAGCEIDQISMIMRHGERYPDSYTVSQINAGLKKVYAANITKWAGDLAFLNDWTSWLSDPALLEQESFSGPYSGLLDAFKRGADYRHRYGHLWDQQSIIPIFAGGYTRVIETARYFGEGFFGYNYSTNAAINIISENVTMGANSITPTCPADTGLIACFFANRTFSQFAVAAERFNAQNPGLNLNSTDAKNLMAIPGFELQTRGYSPWVDAFTLDEWVAYGYTNDLSYYYCTGPGDPYQVAVGQVFANATLTLFQSGPEKSLPLSFNFAHDAYITPIVAALGLDTPSSPLPNDTIPFPNPYKSSDIVPMGGHLVLERLTCNATAQSTKGSTFVRALINEAVVPWPKCQSGPGFSCPLANFTQIVQSAPNFVKTCGVDKAGYPQYLDFWWNYNKTTDLNYLKGKIPYQQTYTLT